MFTAALFVKSRTWKQPEHPSSGDGINNGSIAIERNRTAATRNTRIILKRIMLWEGNHTKQGTFCRIAFI